MKRLYPWLIAGFISLLGILQAVMNLADNAALANIILEFLFFLVFGLYAFVGALIVVRQGGNRVGWLLMIIAFAGASPFVSLLKIFVPEPPTILTFWPWLLLWLQSFTLELAILTIFQLVLNFPAGRPPSFSRWNWINHIMVVTLSLIALRGTFSAQMGPVTGEWDVTNPLGILPSSVYQGVTLVGGIGLVAVAVGSLVSLYFRFRRGGHMERQQIKWLLFAGAVFLLAAGLTIAQWSTMEATVADISWQLVLFLFSWMLFPLAIANAIMRYRLYEIDIVIRRTLQYTIVTALLVFLYFGGIIVLQRIVDPLTGVSNSPLVTVITTLGVAALFDPIRHRAQLFIDRRFYRKKYDAQQVLAQFAQSARDEVEMQELTTALTSTIRETLQPDRLGLWIRPFDN